MSCVIFITETDIIGLGRTVYKFGTRPFDFAVPPHAQKRLDPKRFEMYINCATEDMSNDLGKLAHDFLCSDPNDMLLQEIAEATRSFKNSRFGVKKMGDTIDEYIEARAEERAVILAEERVAKLAEERVAKLALTFAQNRSA